MYNEKVWLEGLPKSAFGKYYNVEFYVGEKRIDDNSPRIATFNSKLIAEDAAMFMFMDETGGIEMINKSRLVSMICTERTRYESRYHKSIFDEYFRKST